jgi:hypothetical protein
MKLDMFDIHVHCGNVKDTNFISARRKELNLKHAALLPYWDMFLYFFYKGTHTDKKLKLQ